MPNWSWLEFLFIEDLIHPKNRIACSWMKSTTRCTSQRIQTKPEYSFIKLEEDLESNQDYQDLSRSQLSAAFNNNYITPLKHLPSNPGEKKYCKFKLIWKYIRNYNLSLSYIIFVFVSSSQKCLELLHTNSYAYRLRWNVVFRNCIYWSELCRKKLSDMCFETGYEYRCYLYITLHIAFHLCVDTEAYKYSTYVCTHIILCGRDCCILL